MAQQGLAAARRQLGTTRRRLSPKLTTRGLDRANKDLKTSKRNLADLRKPLKVAANDIVGLMADTFRNEADPMGRKWGELKESTIRQRIGMTIGGRAGKHKTWKKGSYRIKQELTAGQRGAITRKRRFSKGGAYKGRYAKKAFAAVFGDKRMRILNRSGQGGLMGSIFADVIGKRAITFGANKFYLIYHQMGRKDGTMVARRVAPVEWVGSKWKTMKVGAAGARFNELLVRLLDHGSPIRE